MIDYAILNPKKQIWLNLELYFTSYDFSNFIEFYGIFLNLFDFYFDFQIFKLIKKGAKMGVLSRVYTWRWCGVDRIFIFTLSIYLQKI